MASGSHLCRSFSGNGISSESLSGCSLVALRRKNRLVEPLGHGVMGTAFEHLGWILRSHPPVATGQMSDGREDLRPELAAMSFDDGIGLTFEG